mmetsp:Transcript_78471/g.197155  ORF Transcript_78471/g.197155 Transcript_78471/m.197155 type:complete len:301 (-) Transcript_78471:97-999(-)
MHAVATVLQGIHSPGAHALPLPALHAAVNNFLAMPEPEGWTPGGTGFDTLFEKKSPAAGGPVIECACLARCLGTAPKPNAKEVLQLVPPASVIRRPMRASLQENFHNCSAVSPHSSPASKSQPEALAYAPPKEDPSAQWTTSISAVVREPESPRMPPTPLMPSAAAAVTIPPPPGLTIAKAGQLICEFGASLPQPPPPSPLALAAMDRPTTTPSSGHVHMMDVEHSIGKCKPCIYHANGGCKKDGCTFCHRRHDERQMRRVRPSKNTRRCLDHRAKKLAQMDAAAAGSGQAMLKVCILSF